MSSKLKLRVQQIQDACLFELFWGKGQSLVANLAYPLSLSIAYQTWQAAYLHFYQSLPEDLTDHNDGTAWSKLRWRGRVEDSGQLTPRRPNRHQALLKAEAQLLHEFQRWLRSPELYEIRAVIVHAVTTQHRDRSQHVDLVLTCDPIALERLPWETWQIGSEAVGATFIRIARCPRSIRSAVKRSQVHIQGKVRILIILGDETGLNFQADREAVRSLAPIAEIEFCGWQAGQSTHHLKTDICQAIADSQGWNILLFAGHSNETVLTGGELMIAPGVSCSIQELIPSLKIARDRGLQFALFNSCSGLNIANALIDLGLNQVTIFREPIHNRVAQKFLVEFLHHLTCYLNVHSALLQTCQTLYSEQALYPSAYLIPSLFCHPETELFQLKPTGFPVFLKKVKPMKWEVVSVGMLLTFSLLLPIQNALLNYRTWVQAIYRDLTHQKDVGSVGQIRPVLLIQVDEESIRRSTMTNPNPIDRTYIAALIESLAPYDIKILGIDYLFDRQQPIGDKVLAAAVQDIIVQSDTWVTFAALKEGKIGEVGVNPHTRISHPAWSLQGYIEGFENRMTLLSPGGDCRQRCPFAYLLSLVATYLYSQDTENPIQPDVQHAQIEHAESLQTELLGTQSLQTGSLQTGSLQTGSLRTRLLDAIEAIRIEQTLKESNRSPTLLDRLSDLRLHPLSHKSQAIGQLWLHPLVDFSISPTHVYDRIAAWEILENTATSKALLQSQPSIVLIASGGYSEAGINGQDFFSRPLALEYWNLRSLEVDPNRKSLSVLTGAEVHAYTTHHLLNQHLLIPIPDTWMVLLSALLSKMLIICWQISVWRKLIWTGIGVSAVYFLFSLQIYLMAALVFPMLFPITVFWIYLLQARKQ